MSVAPFTAEVRFRSLGGRTVTFNVDRIVAGLQRPPSNLRETLAQIDFLASCVTAGQLTADEMLDMPTPVFQRAMGELKDELGRAIRRRPAPTR